MPNPCLSSPCTLRRRHDLAQFLDPSPLLHLPSHFQVVCISSSPHKCLIIIIYHRPLPTRPVRPLGMSSLCLSSSCSLFAPALGSIAYNPSPNAPAMVDTRLTLMPGALSCGHASLVLSPSPSLSLHLSFPHDPTCTPRSVIRLARIRVCRRVTSTRLVAPHTLVCLGPRMHDAYT